MGTNNLGRTNVVINQDGKEATIAASDDALDAALTASLTITWSGADALQTLTTAQLQGNLSFIMAGTTSEPAPVLKMAAVQRGLVLVSNGLTVTLEVQDYTSSTALLIPAGETHAIFVTAASIVRIFDADNVILPADTSLTPCRVATTANITIATALNSGDVIDGVTLADGDRVLVWKQTAPEENGIYVVDAVPFRATDFDDTAEVVAGSLVAVTEGTANADKLFMLSTNNPITVDVTGLTFKNLTSNATTYATEAIMRSGTNTNKALNSSVLSSLWKKGSNVASASTIALGAGHYFHITGTTTITDIDFSQSSLDGRPALLVFDGILNLTHNATSLILPGGADITTQAGDRAYFIQDDGNNVICMFYQRADGSSVVNVDFIAADATEVLTGTDNISGVTSLSLLALWGKGADIASAGTLTIGEGGFFHITGSTTITDIDWAVATDGRPATIVFDSVLTLTHNATSLKLPSGASIITAAGDRACFVQDSGNNVVCLWYTRADGTALVSSGLSLASTTEFLTGTNAAKAVTPDAAAAWWEKGSNIASASTVTVNEGGYHVITGTTTITTITVATDKSGRRFWFRFNNTLTLTHNATSLILPSGASITTAADDTALFVSEGSGNVRCLAYIRADGSALVSTGFTAASTTEQLTGTETTKASTPDSVAALWEKGSDVASAGTVSFGEGGYFHITGTTTITDMDWATAKNGRWAWVVFDGILTLTHNATTLVLPTGASITTAAGDRALFIQDAGDNVICMSYQRADGTALASGGFTAASTTEALTGTDVTKGITADALAALWEKGSDEASAATVSFGEGGYFHITGTTTITDIDWDTDKNGRWAWVVFDGVLTLTHNATSLILPGGANITTAANDRALFIQDASNNVYCMAYIRADGRSVIAYSQPKELIVAASDETSSITTGTAKVTFRAPRAMTLTGIKASLSTAGSGTTTVDVKLNGSTIMTTNKLNFDASEKTTATYSGSAAALTTTAIADDDEFTIDIVTAGSGAKGLKVTLLYT